MGMIEPTENLADAAGGRGARGAACRSAVAIAAIAALALSDCGGSSAPPNGATRTPSASHVPTIGTTRTSTAQPRATTNATSTRRAPTPPARAPKTAPVRLAGREWTLIPTKRRVVALTFDAGANADGVGSILATLKREHVPATVFLTGNFVEHFQTAARKIVAAGMRIGNHSISHPYFTKLTKTQIRAQVRRAADQIASVTGARPWPWFRFPFGDRNARSIAVVNSAGFVPIGWTVDTLGWQGKSRGITVRTVKSRVLAHLKPGEIVLMHCGSNPTDHSTLDADALPAVIKALRARGYSFVTLDAFLA